MDIDAIMAMLATLVETQKQHTQSHPRVARGPARGPGQAELSLATSMQKLGAKTKEMEAHFKALRAHKHGQEAQGCSCVGVECGGYGYELRHIGLSGS